MTTNDTLRGNIEAALRLLLKSEKDYLRRAAEVGIEDLGILVARLDEKLSIESTDAWLSHRFNEVYDEKKCLEEQLEAALASMRHWQAESERSERYAEERDQVAQRFEEQLEALRAAMQETDDRYQEWRHTIGGEESLDAVGAVIEAVYHQRLVLSGAVSSPAKRPS